MTVLVQTPKDWTKILWKRQSFQDNYIPPASFLSSLRRNSNFKPQTYWPLVLLSCAITQHISTIFIFLSIFVWIQQSKLDPRTMVWITGGSSLVGYAIWEVLDSISVKTSERYANRLKALKSSILIFLALMSLTPVLRTLTAATSSDSIWALTSILFILNTLLADYSALKNAGQVQGRLTSVLSMNAAMSASIVLASRLTADIAVFALILFSVQVFTLYPFLRHRLKASSTIIQGTTTMLLSILAVALTASLSWTITFLLSIGLLLITFLAPAFLVWAQKYKNEIRGPWDVAVPKVN
ncbi:phosphatidylinositol N-acetylglucosaminyltransferase subunit C [Collybia nuda]|uniref:Phosphatidylinositol N-acetylglucosaminyltransferase subunit C n=1 Tax=Collybia nuda TaxID=64659 RepID=A0A9P5XTH1_9AGAR|nr:phosphatidylinositol N-acetylglucosaminyltransferase subunit C [Collybia nuda]